MQSFFTQSQKSRHPDSGSANMREYQNHKDPSLYFILAQSTWRKEKKNSSLGFNKMFWFWTVHNFVSNNQENIEMFCWINELVVLQKPSS